MRWRPLPKQSGTAQCLPYHRAPRAGGGDGVLSIGDRGERDLRDACEERNTREELDVCTDLERDTREEREVRSRDVLDTCEDLREGCDI